MERMELLQLQQLLHAACNVSPKPSPAAPSIHADWLRGCSSGMLRSAKSCMERLHENGQWPQPSLHAAWLRVNATLGSYSVLFVGDSTLYNKVRWLESIGGQGSAMPSACERGHGICFAYGTVSCDIDSARHVRRSDFDAIVWSEGLHWLLRPLRKEEHTIADYRTAVQQCASQLASRFPRARKLYKETNWVCSRNFYGAWANWAHGGERARAEARGALTMSEVGVQQLRQVERTTVHGFGWELLPSATDNTTCECSGRGDGRHYIPLVPHFAMTLAGVVASERGRPPV